MKYVEYKEITKNILDSIKVGDYVRINGWKRGMKVKAISDNYFIMSSKSFGKNIYSICEKKPLNFSRNEMISDKFHCGPDNMVFGWGPTQTIHEYFNEFYHGDYNPYSFEKEKYNKEYLKDLESGEVELSVRRVVPINYLYIRRGSNSNGK